MPPNTKIPKTREEWSKVAEVLTSADPEFERNGLYLLKGGVVVSVLERSPPINNPLSTFLNTANIRVQVLYEDGSCSPQLKLALDANPANSKENALERILSEHKGEQLEGFVGVRFAKSAIPKVSTYYLCLTGLVEAVVVGNKVTDYNLLKKVEVK